MKNKNTLLDYFDLFPYPHPIDIISLIDQGLREPYDIADEKEYIFPDNINKKINNVLIVGCGCNQLIYHAYRNPKIKFVGVDFSDVVESHVTSVIKDKKLKNAKFIKDDYMNLSSETFDIIIAIDVINYSDNPKLSLQYLTNLLNDNGSIILSLPSSHYYSSIDKFKEIIKDLKLNFKSKDDIQYAFNLVKSLLQLHPSRVNIYEKNGWIAEDDFVNRFMSPKNHSFNVFDINKLIKESNLFFQNWFDNSNYFPKAFFDPNNPDLPGINDKFRNLNTLDLWDMMLTIKGPHLTNKKHTFSLRKDINYNYYQDLIDNVDSYVYRRPNNLISKNRSHTGTLLARSNYKRILNDQESDIINKLSKPVKINDLLNSTDFSLEELNVILQNLWEYSAISYYRG